MTKKPGTDDQREILTPDQLREMRERLLRERTDQQKELGAVPISVDLRKDGSDHVVWAIPQEKFMADLASATLGTKQDKVVLDAMISGHWTKADDRIHKDNPDWVPLGLNDAKHIVWGIPQEKFMRDFAGATVSPPGGQAISSASGQAALPAAAVSAVQEDLKRRGLYGGAIDGKWDAAAMNGGFEKLIALAQDKPEYAKAGGVPDGLYGPHTQKSFDAMAGRGEIDLKTVEAIKALNGTGQLKQVYLPEDVAGSLRAVRQDPPLYKDQPAARVTAAPAQALPAQLAPARRPDPSGIG